MKIYKLLISVLAVSFLIFPLHAQEKLSPGPDSLEGKSFKGVISGQGILGLFGVKGTLSFKDGNLIWKVGAEDDEYLPAPYATKLEGEKLFFTAKMLGKENDDVVSWKGYYDGERLSKVTAEWVREKGDLVHDSLLPDNVVMIFKQKPVKKSKVKH